eukprot:TRINITY_DN5167_c0_g1_i1.p1 TRINITY_DN5167_c0_g1~~TRINITY_DN5167_c0_g1_i1.p1  ORF type:complete len:756 (+),score=58.19 TRINITY_DN5167_c0_g1_i1:111-2378(+)
MESCANGCGRLAAAGYNTCCRSCTGPCGVHGPVCESVHKASAYAGGPMVKFCVNGCGRQVAAGYETCCRSCSGPGGGHGPICESTHRASAYAGGPLMKFCVNGCGRQVAAGYETCCRSCNGPGGGHGPICESAHKARGFASAPTGASCANGCGRSAAVGYATCCRSCTGFGGSHGPICEGTHKAIMSAGGSVVKSFASDEEVTGLLHDAKNGQWDSVMASVKSKPMILRREPSSRWSTAHHAAWWNRADILDFLVGAGGVSAIVKKDADGQTPLDIAKHKGSKDAMKVIDARVRGDCNCYFAGECKFLKALLAGDYSDEAAEHLKTFVHPLQSCPAGNKCLSFVKLEQRDPNMDAHDKCHVACFFHPRLDPRGGAGQVEVSVNKASASVVLPGIPLHKYFTGPGKDFGSLEEEIKNRGYGHYFPEMNRIVQEKAGHDQHQKVKLAMADIRPRLKDRMEQLRSRYPEYPDGIGCYLSWLQHPHGHWGAEPSESDFIKGLLVDDGLLDNELLALVLYCNCTDLCTDLRRAHRLKDVARFPRWNTHLSRAVTKLFYFDDNNDVLRCGHSLMDPEKSEHLIWARTVEEQKNAYKVPFYHGLNGIGAVVFSELTEHLKSPGDMFDTSVFEYPKFVYSGPVSLSSSRDTAINFAAGVGGSVASPSPYGLLFSFQSLLPGSSSFGSSIAVFKEELRGFSPIGADVKWISQFTEYETIFLDPVFACLSPGAYDVTHQSGCEIAQFSCTNIEAADLDTDIDSES